MPLALPNQGTIWKPEKNETEQARQASGVLDSIYRDVIEEHHGDSLTFFQKVSKSRVSIPPTAILWMLQVLKEVASGNAVTLIPIHAELTTQEAADFLNVSRPFLISLLEQGKIRFRKVGRHRRIQFGDIYDYKLNSEKEQRKTLENMTGQSQDLEGDDFDLEDLKP